ncbi:hypothetical protein B0F90DRAFT_1820285 [Multifurca ochricompacta]|uniref:Uncharacterized protein n=1 Tax=Multifurca ochricompacta TaxID=376703 RepID=A0AAD4QL53_9AGAM|nr:hypothetical protein B0F90DRAFT_1820285 [Multifurca ochricompacta]
MQATTQAQAQKDRYSVLQRKLEHLEKSPDFLNKYQANFDILTKELSAARKSNTDHLARVDKLKKQTEIKELRAKLRTAEAERTGLQTKYEAAIRTKKASESTSAARHDELKERERRIVEFEKALAAEKKRKEDIESQLRDVVNAKAEEEAQRSSESAKAQTQLEQAHAETAEIRARLEADRVHGEMQREGLVTQLEALRDILGQAATHYGKLVSETVSKTAYDQLQREHNSLQFHTFRFERKLANTEAQVAEMASLIRQAQEANGFLEAQLRVAEDDRNMYIAALQDLRIDLSLQGGCGCGSSHILPADALFSSQREFLLSELEIQEAISSTERLSAVFYADLNDELVSSCAAMRADLDAELLVTQTQAIQFQADRAMHDATVADLHTARTELESTRRRLEEASGLLDDVKTREAALMQEVKEVRSQSKEQTTAHKHALQKEKETTNKFASSLQQSKVAEDELRAEINQLTVELADAERYREAYHKLVDEVGVLAARNQLAESEASRLSQFNAEILSHNNPAQRIMYLDRVRRELAETKQMLIIATRERDAASTQIENLRRELSLYLSVPAEGNKPLGRTTRTRIGRMPLITAQSQNVDPVIVPVRGVSADLTKHLSPLGEASCEMTLDEIM